MKKQNKTRRYGCWAGNPEGVPERESDCIAEVHSNDRACHFHQCCRKRGFGPKKEFCKQHAGKIVDGETVLVPKR